MASNIVQKDYSLVMIKKVKQSDVRNSCTNITWRGKNMNCLTALCTRNMSQKVNMFIQYRYICLERHFCHTFNKK